MKETFVIKSLNLIKRYNNTYSEEDIEKIQYGLEGIYLNVTKIFVILLIAVLLGIIKELLMVLLFFNLIRYPAFGVHADKSIVCLITSITLMIGLTLLIYRVDINLYLKLFICIFSFINFLLFAPADTIKRPLTNKKKRKYRKIASCIIAIIYIILVFVLESFISNSIFTALILEAIMINPITYIVLGMPFNNYKKIVKNT